MGETAAQTLSEIQATRATIDRDLDTLEARLPDREQVAAQAKTYGGAAAGGIAVLVAVGVAYTRRKHERELRAQARRQAEALASYYPDAFGGVVEAGSRSRKPAVAAASLAAGAGVGYALFRRDDVRARAQDALEAARIRVT